MSATAWPEIRSAFKIGPDGSLPYPYRAYFVADRRVRVRLFEGFDVVIVSGAAGAGKSTLLKSLAEGSEPVPRSVFLHRPPVTPAELAEACARADTQAPDETDASVTLLIDDAGFNVDEMLDSAQDFSSGGFAPGEGWCLRLVLACLPSQVGTLNAAARARDAGVSVCRIEELEPEEVGSYIAHRLTAAAIDSSPFVAGAIAEIAAFAHGIPRMVNLICAKAALAAELSGAARISGEHVEEAAADLGLERSVVEDEPAFDFTIGSPLAIEVPLAALPPPPAQELPPAAELSLVDSPLPADLPLQTPDVIREAPVVFADESRSKSSRLAALARWARHHPLRLAGGAASVSLLVLVSAMHFDRARLSVQTSVEPTRVAEAGLALAPSAPQVLRPEPVPAAAPPQHGSPEMSVAPVPVRYVGDLLARGRRLKAEGDLKTARMLLNLAWSGGSARAARELAETYDPQSTSHTASADAGTDSADRAMALQWYERAAAAGDRVARRRMAILMRADRQTASTDADQQPESGQ